MNNESILNLPVSAGILWIIFFIVLVIFGVVSWVLVHHWHYFGIKDNEKLFAKSLFFILSIILLMVMVLLIGFYHFL